TARRACPRVMAARLTASAAPPPAPGGRGGTPRPARARARPARPPPPPPPPRSPRPGRACRGPPPSPPGRPTPRRGPCARGRRRGVEEEADHALEEARPRRVEGAELVHHALVQGRSGGGGRGRAPRLRRPSPARDPALEDGGQRLEGDRLGHVVVHARGQAAL